jgi:hypothetical protein
MVTPPTSNAIPTGYKGRLFRSRLEARWAVFFDEMGIEWGYEVEGYEFGGRRVLADFWLPQYDCFWEVKPAQKLDDAKYGMLAALADKPVVISTRLPHYFGAFIEEGPVVIGFSCAVPVPWTGLEPEMSDGSLRQRLGEQSGRTWAFTENRIPGECPKCRRHTLLWFDADKDLVVCPECGFGGVAVQLMVDIAYAGVAAEQFSFWDPPKSKKRPQGPS